MNELAARWKENAQLAEMLADQWRDVAGKHKEASEAWKLAHRSATNVAIVGWVVAAVAIAGWFIK